LSDFGFINQQHLHLERWPRSDGDRQLLNLLSTEKSGTQTDYRFGGLIVRRKMPSKLLLFYSPRWVNCTNSFTFATGFRQ